VRKHWKLLGRTVPYLRPHKGMAAGTVLLTIVAAVVALAEPWPLAFLIDGVLGGEQGDHGKKLPDFITTFFGTDPKRLILVAVLGGLLLAFVINGVSLLNEYVRTKLSQRMINKFRSDLFGTALQQSVAFHDARSMGDFIARINYEASSMGNVVVALPPLAESVLTLVGMAYVTYRIDAQLALAALTVVPFIYYATGYYGKHIEPKLRGVRLLEGRSITIVYEAMSMLRVIAVFNREKYEHERFRVQATDAVNQRIKLTLRQSLFSFAVNLITAIGTSLVLGLGALHVLNGELSIGEVLVLLSYVHAIYGPLEAISHSMATFQENFIYLDMSLELLDQVPDIRDEPDATPLPDVSGAVEFANVGFAYAGRDYTLTDISLSVQPGEAIAIVGPTGAGKTTMMSLLSRLSQPDEGRVLVDGIDIRSVTLSSLRDQISVVLQEPTLFTGTVADNIRYGRLDADDADVVAAAVAANADDFIQRLPAGYDTLLGEDGTALSGGERQRICIARAFLKDAPILILDEPTSSIDSRTEAVILDALETLMEGRTTFMIAHRLSTLRSVSRIVVLDHGRIVEHGTHHELMRNAGLYRALHDMQASARQQRFHEVGVAPLINPTAAADRELAAQGPLGAAILELADRVRSGRRLGADPRNDAAAAVGSRLRTATIAASPNPIDLPPTSTAASTDIHVRSVGYSQLQVRLDAPDGELFAVIECDPARPHEDIRSTGEWVTDGRIFFLQDVSDGRPLVAEHTLGSVVITVVLGPESVDERFASNVSVGGA
jgi:ATP-binding cassette subfamily B protein